MQENQYGLIAREAMSPSARKVRDFYDIRPGAPIYQKEFGFYVLDRWEREGHIKPRDQVEDYDRYLAELFGYDEPAIHTIYGLGWCEGGFFPKFEEKVLEDRGEYELAQDFAGRSVLYFKGRRNGFMPEYVDHPVKDMASWEEKVKWRLDPNTPGREEETRQALKEAKAGAARGDVVVQGVVGGYMFLRSLIGPEALLYMFFDNPDLLHACMETWLNLADAVIARHQKEVVFDELFLAEDICYNRGALISPDMMREFLFPYYQQLYTNMKRRSLDPARPLHLQIDTDGYCGGVIDLYREIGCDNMSPFEVASGCDVVALGERYGDLRMSGGIDKRLIAQGGDPLKRHLEHIMPAMRKRGGYIPTCDHGVPEETPFENYMLYRRLMREYCN